MARTQKKVRKNHRRRQEIADFVPNGGTFKDVLGRLGNQKNPELTSIGGKKTEKNKAPEMNWNGEPSTKKIRTSFARQAARSNKEGADQTNSIGLWSLFFHEICRDST